MQPIEKALNNVFDFLGNKYDLPAGEYINSDFGEVVQIKNPYYFQSPANVKFSFGTEKELNVWLQGKKEKYPLAWLVYPVTENSDNTPNKIVTYRSMRIIFAINNDSDKLVQTRVQTTRYILDQVVEKFCKLMTQGKFRKYIWMDRNGQHSQKFFPNYSVNSQTDSGQIDIWDAIVLECDIYFNPNCMPK
ncbi:hypothetical protein [Epilithonimonas caeni]|uniref:hypothetical protein n=1 Tax=Epilithonimonas caeni TaxID=365343 RepID=UPI0004046D41|nr:hypothetical protein [Epilithonimonas caeni]